MRARQPFFSYTLAWSVACVVSASCAFGQAKPATPFEGHVSEVTGIAFHPDGIRVASASLRDVRIWDRTRGKEILDLKRSRGGTIAISPDGRHLAIGGFEAVTIHDVADGKQVARIDPHDEWDRTFPSTPRVMALEFSPDGRWLATAASIGQFGESGGFPGGAVKVFEVASGKKVRHVGSFSTQAVALAFSPDGRYLAAGSNGASSEVPEAGELRVWNTMTFDLLFADKGEVPEVPGTSRWSAFRLVFNPDGTRLASASHDNVVRVWDVPGGRQLLTLNGQSDRIRTVRFSLKGEHIISAGGEGVRVWDSTTGEHLRLIPVDANDLRMLMISPDGRWLAGGGGTFKGPGMARVWNLSGNEQR